MNTRGERLRAALCCRGVEKLSAAAAAFGVTESTISRWRADGHMTLENAIALCVVLDLSLDWLLLGRGSMEHHKGAPTVVHPQISKSLARLKPEVREHLSHFLSSIQGISP